MAFRAWLQEHDARARAEYVIQEQDAVVAQLKGQITTAQVQAAQKVQVVKQAVAKAVTPSEVIATLPTLTNLPLNTRPVPNDPINVEVAALPLIQLAGEAKEDKINLEACKLVDTFKDKQLDAKDVEIKALKKKPGFWHKMKSYGETVGISVAVGMILSHI